MKSEETYKSVAFRRHLAFGLVFILLACISPDLPAQNCDPDAPTCSESTSDVWLFNTRCLACPSNRCSIFSEFPISKLDCNNWIAGSNDDFLATLTPDELVFVFVDGNRVTADEVIERSRQIRHKLQCPNRQIRFVIWSWPSHQQRSGQVRDAKIKLHRSDREAYYLASWLVTLPKEQRVSLIGYSLGARTIMASTHLLAGGCFCQNSLNHDPNVAVRPRLIMFGAAAPNTWMQSNSPVSLSTIQSDKILSIYNSSDVVLKYFRLFADRSKSNLIGFRPVSASCVSTPIEQCNVAQQAGNSHDIKGYMNPTVLNTIRRYALWH